MLNEVSFHRQIRRGEKSALCGKKGFVFCGMLLASCLLVNRAAAMSCHESSGGHQHEEKSANKSEEKKAEKKIDKKKSYSVVYVCPMHPEVQSDKPGKCPKCGMKLKKKKVPTPVKKDQEDPNLKPAK